MEFNGKRYYELALNWIKSIKRIGFEDKILFFATDEEMYEKISKENVKTELLIFEGVPKASQVYNQGEWKKIAMVKYYIVNFLLERFNEFIFSDIDIVFFDDPFKHLSEEKKVKFQSDIVQICAGFFYVSDIETARKIFDLKLLKERESFFNHDQDYLNAFLKENEETIKIDILTEGFPNGRTFMERGWKVMKNDVIMHYNWIVSMDEKIKRMKRYGHWYC